MSNNTVRRDDGTVREIVYRCDICDHLSDTHGRSAADYHGAGAVCEECREPALLKELGGVVGRWRDPRTDDARGS